MYVTSANVIIGEGIDGEEHVSKVKGNIHPRTGHKGPEGSRRIAILFV
jgi:hypothetical protein